MSRPLSDHGTAQQAIDWAIDHNPDGGLEAEAFLRCWREGRLDEWPEFYAWLALEEARSPVISRQSSEEQYPQSETQSSAGNDARDTINTTSQIQHVPRREGEGDMGLFPSMPQPLRGYAHYIEAALSYYHGGPADFDVWLAWKGITNRLQELSAELKHAKALLSLPQPGGWRPISEAPSGQRETLLLTDGRAVLLGGRSWVCTGEQTPDGFWHTQSGSGWNPNFSFTPTHWQPLPPVPTDGGREP